MGVDSGAEVPVVSFDADVVFSGLFVTKVVVVSPPACTVKLFFEFMQIQIEGLAVMSIKQCCFNCFPEKFARITKASADFKNYAKKVGRRQKFSKKFLLVKTEAPSFQKEV